MDKLDYKKAYPELYLPPRTPMLIDVPAMPFIMVEGCGDPNEEDGAYSHAVELLYSLSYTIKMSHKSGSMPAGYIEYAVPPLEGLWWMKEGGAPDFLHKERFCWISMIRQPDFVTPDVFAWAQSQVKRKKPALTPSFARLQAFAEGYCVQCMHIGPYDEEPATVARMEQFMLGQGLIHDFDAPLPGGLLRRHHEIYLNDPRKTSPDKVKVVLRHPVVKKKTDTQ